MKFKIFFLFVLITNYGNVFSQENFNIEKLSELSLGLVQTELEKSAINFAFDHIPWFGKDSSLTILGDNWMFARLGYELSIKQGGNDAFDSIVGSSKWFTIIGKNPDITGDSFFLVPFGGGFEADRNADNVAIIGEIGLVPVWRLKQQAGVDKPTHYGYGTNRAGIFIQTGYKTTSDSDDMPAMSVGGDDSDNKEDEGELLRFKLDVRHQFNILGYSNDTIIFLPNAKAWYDVINDEIYYHAEAKIKIKLPEWPILSEITGKKSLDFSYEKGSGAPNFNEGDQFSANLSIQF